MINSTHTDLRLRPPASVGSSRDGQPSFWTIVVRLPKYVGARLYAANDAEAGWRGWEVHERWLGLKRRYRDPRFGRYPGGE